MNEQQVKTLIIERYGSIRAFSEFVDIPNSTVVSILERGFLNSKLKNVFAICKALNIRPEMLESGFDFSAGANVYGNNTGINTTGDINGNVSFGSTIQKEDLHEVASNLNLTDRELQEKTLSEVADLRASQARLENAINSLSENQTNVLANMKSVDDSFNEILADVKEVGEVFKEILKEFKK